MITILEQPFDVLSTGLVKHYSGMDVRHVQKEEEEKSKVWVLWLFEAEYIASGTSRIWITHNQIGRQIITINS